MMLTDKYGFKVIGCHGPSMLPTIDAKDNLVVVDCFTTRFVRKPKKGEIVISENPFKQNGTLVKRVVFTEGETASFFSHREGRNVQVLVPQGHLWLEGDNKD